MAVTEYLWDSATDSLVEEYDGAGTLQAQYTQTPALYGPLISSHRPAGGSQYFHFDALGSTRRLSDDNESLSPPLNYSAFGEELAPAANVPPFRFVGELGYYFDEEVETTYVRSRSYDARLGRWHSVDPYPLGFENFYGYVGNAPTIYRDPSGCQIFLVEPPPTIIIDEVPPTYIIEETPPTWRVPTWWRELVDTSPRPAPVRPRPRPVGRPWEESPWPGRPPWQTRPKPAPSNPLCPVEPEVPPTFRPHIRPMPSSIPDPWGKPSPQPWYDWRPSADEPDDAAEKKGRCTCVYDRGGGQQYEDMQGPRTLAQCRSACKSWYPNDLIKIKWNGMWYDP